MKNTAPIIAFTAMSLWASTALGQSYIRRPQDHGKVEVEVHGVFGFGAYHGAGFGAGLRVGIPIVPNGPIRTINNSMAINFGADFVWWAFDYYRCDATFGCGYNGYAGLILPVVLQWNFYVHNRWSIAPEIGFAPEIHFYDRSRWWCDGCSCWAFCPWPVVAFTARFHFRDNNQYPALTMRLGFPVGFNIGVSF